MTELYRPKIELLAGSADESYGKFVVEPLERGFGVTLGNALRRILLSFIQGLAFTSVRIEGVVHEFSTIPGVYEDTTELLLNLKEAFLRPVVDDVASANLPEDEVWTATIDASGECEITAGDIQCPPEFEVARPDQHIATLTSPEARLYMELDIMAGRGYRGAEAQETSAEVGRIPMDSIFSPVKTANFIVEPTRREHRTDLDRLILEVQTNGGITAAGAIDQAARVLDQYLRFFFDFRAVSEGAERADDQSGSGESAVLDYRIEDLDFSVRTFNCLKKEGVLTVRELIQKTEQDLMAIRNFGKKSLTEVQQKLASLGQSLLRPEDEDEEPDEDEVIDEQDDDEE
ncbi:MAG: DNA-directed RNA polymerase subunit alpha [Armatimonadota bacterium]|jgi:DNA-directed RNA polymerase subunit alpha|nr:DNA-directed RNA polymerase subunit alpha [Acidobacteriota bacterium]NLN90621.1 DNA-directed RNA polymerase subunit alpha [candidate division WS1 bacterium]